MLFNQLVREVQVDKDQVHDLLVGVVLLKALFDILQISHITDFRGEWLHLL